MAEEKKTNLSDAAKHSLGKDGVAKGAFVRPATKFHNVISNEKGAKFPAEVGRYHLYVSLACPWAHRTLVVRALKGLEKIVSFSVVDPDLKEIGTEDYIGWKFNEKYPDPLHSDTKSTWDIYKLAVPDYPAKYLSVPILFDRKSNTIVNNESAEIIEMFNVCFNHLPECGNPKLDLSPEDLKESMAKVNEWVYPQINDGVYRCGFARSQEAYGEAFDKLFDGMDKLEAILSKSRYLCGDRLTLSDIRAWTTLVRFDPVYFVHFKCNQKRLIQYPNIFGFTREIYQLPGVKQTVDIDHIKFHYYFSHRKVNPRGIIPKGPLIDYDQPHGRGD